MAQVGGVSGSHSRPQPSTLTFLCCGWQGRGVMGWEEVTWYGAYSSDICDVLTLDCWMDGSLILNPPATQVSPCTVSMHMVLPQGLWMYLLLVIGK